MEDNNVKEKKHFFHKKEKQTEVAEVPKKKKKVWLIVLIIAAIVIVLIGTAVKNMTSQIETASNTVEVEPVEKRDLSDSVSLKGTIAGQSKTNVMSLAAAEITAVNVQVGDIVKEGDPLVTLDQNDIEKQIRFLYKGIIIKHNKTEPTYTKTSLFLCEKRRFFMGRTEKGGKVF